MVWKIFKRDLRRILRNFVALVVIIGVCFIPALYAWFNIYANIDPYNNTKNIRVAVVNADQGAYSKVTGPLELGNQVQRQLRKNHQLGWRFVSAENAREGVANGEYYAAIVIPEGFSRSIISVLSGKIKRPRIEYYCNEKKNAISPKVTDSGATALQTRINETFVKVVSGVVSDTIDRTGPCRMPGPPLPFTQNSSTVLWTACTLRWKPSGVIPPGRQPGSARLMTGSAGSFSRR